MQLELHPAQTVEQGFGILLVASLASVVGAQGHTAYASELLGRNLGILLTVELLPEILVQPAAIHLRLRHRGSGRQTGRGDNGESKNGTCKTLHIGVSLSQQRWNSRRSL